MYGTMMTIHANGTTTFANFKSRIHLDELKKGVGGYIEIIPGFNRIEDLDGVKRDCVAFCNEEGKLRRLPFNKNATSLWLESGGAGSDVLVGDVIVLYGDDEFMGEL